MGLDAYAYAVPTELVGDREVDLDVKDVEGYLLGGSQIAYWRKFNALHGWMSDLYFKKGGKDPEFNCNTVRLMSEDLDELERAAIGKTLKPRSGFFFGDTSLPFSDLDRDEVLDFIANAHRAIGDNLAVVYDSFW